MQLKKSSKIALAAASLLGASQVSIVSAADWDHEAAVLYYGESDDRVQDASFKYKGKRTNDDDNVLTLGLGVDTLTGSSPSGIAPSGDVQIVATPSGNGTTTYPANELTLDDTFLDTRVDLSASWDQSIIDDNTRVNVGVSVSKEYDYLHLGLSSGISRELNNKNTTLSLGLAYSADTIEPVGNTPIGLSDISAAKGASDESKDTIDFVVGITQVLSKNTILQVNYGLTQADGYLNDPYKRISRVNSTGTIVQNLNESRPDKRLGHNLYGALKHDFSGNVLSSSARLHSDDFGIDSITLDAKYNIKLSNRRSIEPHLRYYHQSAADFYAPQLNAADPLPAFASADYRLAEFDAYTLGATYRFGGSKDREWRITGELYSQNPKKTNLTAGQAGLDANPGFDAIMLSVGVKF
ncbi:MAG: DUF3570 domain-containing protein [Cocleimonas sp.]